MNSLPCAAGQIWETQNSKIGGTELKLIISSEEYVEKTNRVITLPIRVNAMPEYDYDVQFTTIGSNGIISNVVSASLPFSITTRALSRFKYNLPKEVMKHVRAKLMFSLFGEQLFTEEEILSNFFRKEHSIRPKDFTIAEQVIYTDGSKTREEEEHDYFIQQQLMELSKTDITAAHIISPDLKNNTRKLAE